MASKDLSNENQHTPGAPKPYIQADIPSDLRKKDSRRREVNPRTCRGKSDSNNLQGEAISGRKRLAGGKKLVKAEFQMNFQNDEDKAEASMTASDISGIEKISLNLKHKTLKLEGDFDAKEVLQRLEKICKTQLVSEQIFSSMPKTAKTENQSVLYSEQKTNLDL